MSQDRFDTHSADPRLASIPTLRGAHDGKGMKIALVAAQFNSHITEKLLLGAHETLVAHGVASLDITVIWVPGAFELPLICRKVAFSGHYQAVIAIGCVIRGDTTHYDYVCQAATDGILRGGMETETPIIFGVLTTENLEQALARAGVGGHNKGVEIALAALEMASLQKQLERQLIF